MSIIDSLPSVLGLKGNQANIKIAHEIAAKNKADALQELVDGLKSKNKRIQSDCIKTLYETGYIKPEMIANYYGEFLDLLNSKNNRLVWGGMIAISIITDLKPKEIFSQLKLIVQTVNNGSVITIDCGVEIYAKLNKHKKFFIKTDPLLMDQLTKCPIKQLGQYAEKAEVGINEKNKSIYLNILNNRMMECEKDSQKKRLNKILKRFG